jgi:hypothetical protein
MHKFQTWFVSQIIRILIMQHILHRSAYLYTCLKRGHFLLPRHSVSFTIYLHEMRVTATTVLHYKNWALLRQQQNRPQSASSHFITQCSLPRLSLLSNLLILLTWGFPANMAYPFIETTTLDTQTSTYLLTHSLHGAGYSMKSWLSLSLSNNSLRSLRNPKVHHRADKSLPLDQILSQSNPVRPIDPISPRTILILSSHLRLGLPNDLLHSGLPTKTL